MEKYASLKDTAQFLKNLGFVDLDGDFKFFDSPGTVNVGDYKMSVVQVHVYRCLYGFYCVDIDGGGYMKPIVWHGPKADWDESDVGQEFVQYLDKHFSGWRAN